MDLQLTGKRALVTGASAGIGQAAVRLLAREGVHVIASGRRREALEALASEVAETGAPRPAAITGDLGSAEGCARLAAEALEAADGEIDILINNAGASFPLPDPSDEARWAQSHQLNFVAARQVTGAIVPGMRDRQWGRIINVTGTLVARAPDAAAPAKAALHSWSRALSAELAPFGITVNTIAPGRIHSDQIDQRLHPTAESRQAFIDRFIPAGYFGEPEDMAYLIAFLASPLARYITGEVIHVDGGMRRFAF